MVRLPAAHADKGPTSVGQPLPSDIRTKPAAKAIAYDVRLQLLGQDQYGATLIFGEHNGHALVMRPDGIAQTHVKRNTEGFLPRKPKTKTDDETAHL